MGWSAPIAHTIAGSSTGNNVTTSGIDTTGANFIAVVVATFGSGAVLTDSNGNTWTPRTAYGDAADKRVQIYYCPSPTVGAGHTFTATSTGKDPTIAVIALSGGDAVSPFDVENGGKNTAASTTFQAGSVTPSVDNELIIAGYAGYSGDVSSIDSSFTLLDHLGTLSSKHVSCGLAYQIQTTATARNPTWTLGALNVSAATNATFKAASGGGSVTPWAAGVTHSVGAAF